MQEDQKEEEDKNSYEKLRDKQVAVTDLVVFFLEDLLTKVNRRITTKGRQLEVKLKVPSSIAHPWFVAIDTYQTRKDCQVHFTPLKVHRCGYTEYKRATAKFLNLGWVNLHIRRVHGRDIFSTFRKKMRQQSHGKCCITAASPAVMTYTYKSCTLIFQCKYLLYNRYGNIC